MEVRGKSQSAELRAEDWLVPHKQVEKGPLVKRDHQRAESLPQQHFREIWKTTITVKACRNLPGSDTLLSPRSTPAAQLPSPDPYVKITAFESPKVKPTPANPEFQQTKTQKKTRDPTYEETFEWHSELCKLHIEVWSKNQVQKDQRVAKCEVKLYEDEDLKDFPVAKQVFKITRQFPEGGFVDLEIIPSYEPKTVLWKKISERTTLDAQKWAERVVNLDAGTLKFHLPPRITKRDHITAHKVWFQSLKPVLPEKCDDYVIMTVSEEVKLDCKTKQQRIERHDGFIGYLLRTHPEKKLVKSGEQTISGIEGFFNIFYGTHTDHHQKHITTSTISYQFTFYTGDYCVSLMTTTACSKLDFQRAWENYEETYAKEWIGVFHTFTFTPHTLADGAETPN